MTIAAMKLALEFIKAGSAKYAVDTLEAAISEQEQCEPVGHNFKSPQQRDYEMVQVINKASNPAPVPTGWQLVPVEPTPEMLKAGRKADWEWLNSDEEESGFESGLVAIYKAMLQTAPKVEMK